MTSNLTKTIVNTTSIGSSAVIIVITVATDVTISTITAIRDEITTNKTSNERKAVKSVKKRAVSLLSILRRSRTIIKSSLNE